MTRLGSSARFLRACARPDQFPTPDVPEVAFVGRSNVGKSSLINLALGRKHLVKVSRVPGKTQTVNFFEADERVRFVDLPGYGFARVPLALRAAWRPLVESYLRDRETLRGVVVVVDPRHPASSLDVEVHAWLQAARVPLLVVATKSDQVPRSQRRQAASAIRSALGLTEPEGPLFVSAKTGEGKGPLLAAIGRLLHAPSV